MKIPARWLTAVTVGLCLFNGLSAATSSRPTVKLSSGVTGEWWDAATGEEGVPNAQGVNYTEQIVLPVTVSGE